MLTNVKQLGQGLIFKAIGAQLHIRASTAYRIQKNRNSIEIVSATDPAIDTETEICIPINEGDQDTESSGEIPLEMDSEIDSESSENESDSGSSSAEEKKKIQKSSIGCKETVCP